MVDRLKRMIADDALHFCSGPSGRKSYAF